MNLTSFTYSLPAVAPRLPEVTSVAQVVSCPADPLAARASIMALQEHMLRTLAPEERVDCPLVHRFAPGVYAREILIPAGTVIIGKIHRHAHLNFLVSGRVSVATEFGVVEMEGPYTFVSEPGTKRAVVAITDVVWTTIHANPNDETDLAKIEDFVIAPGYEQLGIADVPAAALRSDTRLIGDGETS